MAAGGELQLLGAWYSPYVFRAKVALALKGLSYEYLEQDLFHKSDLLLRSNPVHKTVPVLIHGGRPVCESLVILQYVDEVWAETGAPLLTPVDAYDRATARFWVAYVDDKHTTALTTSVTYSPSIRCKTLISAMAGGGELQLLGSWYSPYAIRAKLALGLKGLSYEYIEEDLSDKSDLLLRHNPVHKKVPVLIHGGKPVCESLVVVQYVDEAWAGTEPALLPADAYDRATARFWAAYVDDKFFQSWRPLFRSTTDEQRGEAFKSTVPQVETMERAFWECSKGKDFFGGDAVGLVDIALGSFLVWYKVVDEVAGTNLLDEAKFPGLAAWAERFLAVDAVKEVMPDNGKLLEHYKEFMAKWASPAAPAGYN